MIRSPEEAQQLSERLPEMIAHLIACGFVREVNNAAKIFNTKIASVTGQENLDPASDEVQKNPQIWEAIEEYHTALRSLMS